MTKLVIVIAVAVLVGNAMDKKWNRRHYRPFPSTVSWAAMATVIYYTQQNPVLAIVLGTITALSIRYVIQKG